MDEYIVVYITPFSSPYLCGFLIGYSAQHALVRILEKFKVSLDQGGKAGAVFMDFSKAIDYMRHYLLIEKIVGLRFLLQINSTNLKLPHK